MTTQEMLQIIALGEDSEHQFKRTITNTESLAAEMAAFSNGPGGMIFVGVEDNGTITGLSIDDVRRINQLISNAASQNVRPAINPTTQNIGTDKGIVLVITVPMGIDKPNNESLHADEQPVRGTSIDDLDLEYFTDFFDKNNKTPINEQSIPLVNLLQNMKIMHNDNLTLAGAVLFGKDLRFKVPLATVKAVAFFGNSMADTRYVDNREITGKMIDIYRESISFFSNNLRLIQVEDNFNTPGVMEIPLTVFQEIIVNALIHRDFFVPANIRFMVFKNRIEITSPGHLPNTLTTESIKYGISTKRNPLLSSFASRILPYNGLGTGIKRALEAYPDITFEDDRVCNQFKVTIARREITQ
ncbi:transcriptional regulator [Spirochaetia bacterium]|nr:transcriptional regulator [Spirochaetia bacterium]